MSLNAQATETTQATQAPQTIEIKLHEGTKQELKTKEVLEGFLTKYNPTPYYFSKTVLIQDGVIAHSHPVPTLNSRFVNEPEQLFAVFLHEQIHWFFFAPGDDKMNTFFAKLKAKFPTVPSFEEGGARDQESTYLHFGVCYYEFLALSKYLGEKRARELFKDAKVYRWIKKEILNNGPAIKQALEESGLSWKPAT